MEQDAIAGELRAAIWQIDPDLPLDELVTMEQRVSASVATPRFLAALLSAFAAVALLLACSGIYGSMLYTVGQRRREMGIRVAFGATGRDVMGLVTRYGFLLAGLGVAIGTVAALLMSRVMEQLVWGVKATDPVTFAGTAGVLALAAVLASLVPAWGVIGSLTSSAAAGTTAPVCCPWPTPVPTPTGASSSSPTPRRRT